MRYVAHPVYWKGQILAEVETWAQKLEKLAAYDAEPHALFAIERIGLRRRLLTRPLQAVCSCGWTSSKVRSYRSQRRAWRKAEQLHREHRRAFRR